MGKTGLRSFAMTLAAVLLSGPSGHGAEADAQPPRSQARPTTKRVARARTKPEMTASWQARHGLYYRRNWGVEIVGVRRISSGLMLRFDYRVLDPRMAVSLNDKNARPYLIDEATHTALSVPAMENVGELRQMAPFASNRTYFIIFGNPGGLVKHNGRVTLVMGNLRAEGLVVQ